MVTLNCRHVATRHVGHVLHPCLGSPASLLTLLTVPQAGVGRPALLPHIHQGGGGCRGNGSGRRGGRMLRSRRRGRGGGTDAVDLSLLHGGGERASSRGALAAAPLAHPSAPCRPHFGPALSYNWRRPPAALPSPPRRPDARRPPHGHRRPQTGRCSQRTNPPTPLTMPPAL